MLFKKKYKKKKKAKKKKIFTDRHTDGRTAQNYSLEPHKKIQSIMIPIGNRLGNRNRVQNNYTSLAAFKKLTWITCTIWGGITVIAIIGM